MRRTTTCAFGLLALIIAAGPATAQGKPDPMRAAAQVTTVPSPADPMVALRAPTEAAEDGPAASEEFGGLPDAPGAEETFYQCTACHSTEIIKQQRVTDTRWDEMWTWMVEEQGMFEPDAETKTVILDYLKTHFSSDG